MLKRIALLGAMAASGEPELQRWPWRLLPGVLLAAAWAGG
jgi:hypothetical protein